MLWAKSVPSKCKRLHNEVKFVLKITIAGLASSKRKESFVFIELSMSTNVVPANINTSEQDRKEKKMRRKSLHLRRLAHSPEKGDGDTAASLSLPMTPLAQYSERGVLSPRIGAPGDMARISPISPVSEAKIPMAISWPNLSTVSGRLLLSPRAKEMSPRDRNRQMLASSAEKALSLSKTISIGNDNDNDDDDVAVQDNPATLASKRHSVDLTSRSRSALSRSQLMPLFEKTTVSEILDMNRSTTDSMRRVSSSSTTTTTTSSGDNSSNSTSTEKRNNVFTLDSDLDESSRTSIDQDTLSSPAAAAGAATVDTDGAQRNKTLPRRKSELFFQEFTASAPVGAPASPINSPRSRSGTLLENNGPLIRVNSYSHSSEHGSSRGARIETPRELLTRRLKREKTISKGATVIYFYYEPFEARKMLFVIPNTCITAAMRIVIKRAVKSGDEYIMRSLQCHPACTKTDGICRAHLDPDAVAKFPLIAVLDRKYLVDDYRYPHLLDMFHKAHPSMLLNDWTQYKQKDALCEEFLDVRVTHIYHVRTYV